MGLGQHGSTYRTGGVSFRDGTFTLTVETINGRQSLVLRSKDTGRPPLVIDPGLLNILPRAGDPGSPQDGDIWYDDTAGLFQFREEGVTMTLSGTDAPVDATYVVTSANAELTAELVLGTDVIMAGTAAARPAAGTAGRLYFSTDTNNLERDNGVAWVEIATDDHGSLAGLTDDDHTQYLLVSGTRAMTGDLNMGSQDIINALTLELETNAPSPPVEGTQYHDSICSFWVQVENSAGTPSIDADFNVSGLVDDDVGQVTVTIDLDHASAVSYALVVSHGDNSGAAPGAGASDYRSKAAGSFQFASTNTAGSAFLDTDFCCIGMGT